MGVFSPARHSKGYVVHCIDGDPDNLDISNLELITRGQLAILNRGGKLK